MRYASYQANRKGKLAAASLCVTCRAPTTKFKRCHRCRKAESEYRKKGRQMLKHELAKRIHNRLVSAPFAGDDESEAARDNLVVIFGLDDYTVAVRGAIRDDIEVDDRIILSPIWPGIIRALEPESLADMNLTALAPRIDVVRYGEDDGEEDIPMEWTMRATGIPHARTMLRRSVPGFTREHDFTDAVIFSLLDLPDMPKPEFFGAEVHR